MQNEGESACQKQGQKGQMLAGNREKVVDPAPLERLEEIRRKKPGVGQNHGPDEPGRIRRENLPYPLLEKSLPGKGRHGQVPFSSGTVDRKRVPRLERCLIKHRTEGTSEEMFPFPGSGKRFPAGRPRQAISRFEKTSPAAGGDPDLDRNVL